MIARTAGGARPCGSKHSRTGFGERARARLGISVRHIAVPAREFHQITHISEFGGAAPSLLRLFGRIFFRFYRPIASSNCHQIFAALQQKFSKLQVNTSTVATQPSGLTQCCLL